jgi:hypothetical protein
MAEAQRPASRVVSSSSRPWYDTRSTAVDDADDRDRRTEMPRRQRGDAIKGPVGRRVEDVVATHRLHPLCLVRRDQVLRLRPRRHGYRSCPTRRARNGETAANVRGRSRSPRALPCARPVPARLSVVVPKQRWTRCAATADVALGELELPEGWASCLLAVDPLVGGFDDSGAVLVVALVGAHLAAGVGVNVGECHGDRVGGLLVVAGPRLVAG